MSKAKRLHEAKCALYMVGYYRSLGDSQSAQKELKYAKWLIAGVQKSIYVERLSRAVNAFPKRISFGV
ncbi:hypothetical protein D3C80_129030 [compost metagenome]